MKWRIAIIIIEIILFAALDVGGAGIARAESPNYCATAPDGPNCHLQREPFLFGMVRCSGLSPIELAGAKQEFDTQYGFDHELATDAAWIGTYEARANEFAASIGCPAALRDGALTLAYKIYLPTYRRIFHAE